MKKVLAVTLSLVLVCSLAACGSTETSTSAESSVETSVEASTETSTETSVEASTETSTETSVETTDAVVMTYEEYAAADVDTEVTVETYVQATQSWWDNTINVYAQSADGAYFIYNLACAEEDAAKLVAGTKIRVTGYKSEWSGEVEITDGTFEILDDDTFVADPVDVTASLASDDLANYMNQKVSFTGLTVVAQEDGSAFLYNWDGSGSQDANSDLYFTVADADGNNYSFTVESYLCDNTTDVYKAVEALNVGDVIDCEGFLYWYNGANPHITNVTVK